MAVIIDKAYQICSIVTVVLGFEILGWVEFDNKHLHGPPICLWKVISGNYLLNCSRYEASFHYFLLSAQELQETICNDLFAGAGGEEPTC